MTITCPGGTLRIPFNINDPVIVETSHRPLEENVYAVHINYDARVYIHTYDHSIFDHGIFPVTAVMRRSATCKDINLGVHLCPWFRRDDDIIEWTRIRPSTRKGVYDVSHMYTKERLLLSESYRRRGCIIETVRGVLQPKSIKEWHYTDHVAELKLDDVSCGCII